MDKKLCDNCHHQLFEGHCMKPIKGSTYTEWTRPRQVLNSDGTCDLYKAISKSEKLWDYISTPFRRIKWKLEKIGDWFIYKVIKRMKYGFDIRESWSVYSYTASFVHPRLRRMIDGKIYGVPNSLTLREFVEENRLEQYFCCELKDEWFDASGDLEECFDAWKSILEKIHTSMEITSDDFLEKYDCSDVNEYGERNINKGKYEEQRKDVTEGLRLFGLFFEDLWD